MTLKQLEELWDAWIGSPEMVIPKTMKRPKNFLGATEKYKESFLKFAERKSNG